MGGLDRTGQGISEWKSFDEAILVVFFLPSDFLRFRYLVRCKVAKGSSPSGADIGFVASLELYNHNLVVKSNIPFEFKLRK